MFTKKKKINQSTVISYPLNMAISNLLLHQLIVLEQLTVIEAQPKKKVILSSQHMHAHQIAPCPHLNFVTSF